MEEIAAGYGLIEAPVWDAAHGLYFSDVLKGGIVLLARLGGISTIVPKRRGVGGMALHASGGLVFGGRDISYFDLTSRQSQVLLTAEKAGGIGFNDLTTDRVGRIYVGSLVYGVFGGDPPKPGFLHVIDLDGSMRTLADGVMLTNGLGFSPDGRRLYHSDSVSALVRVYDVSPDGSVKPWRVFASLAPGGLPDGLKVASDGSVWVADARGGRVAVFEPDGRHRMDLIVPLPMVTSVCFGGDDLRDLFVVTGSRGGPNDSCGSVFRTRTDVAGLPQFPARVRLSQ